MEDGIEQHLSLLNNNIITEKIEKENKNEETTNKQIQKENKTQENKPNIDIKSKEQKKEKQD